MHSTGYAKPILDVLDPTGTLFTARLYRDSTVKTMHHENVKVLSWEQHVTSGLFVLPCSAYSLRSCHLTYFDAVSACRMYYGYGTHGQLPILHPSVGNVFLPHKT